MDSYKDITSASYDKHADWYAEKFKRLMDVHRRFEFPTFMHLLRGKKILDIGCGAGDHAAYFQSQGYKLSCIDLCPKMIDLCKEKGLDAQIMDMEHLSFPRESFHGAWAVTSLLHLPKDRFSSVIGDIYTTLQDNGIFYLCLKEGSGESLVRDPHDPQTQRFFAYWKENELLDAVDLHFTPLLCKTRRVGHTDYLQTFLKKRVR